MLPTGGSYRHHLQFEARAYHDIDIFGKNNTQAITEQHGLNHFPRMA